MNAASNEFNEINLRRFDLRGLTVAGVTKDYELNLAFRIMEIPEIHDTRALSLGTHSIAESYLKNRKSRAQQQPVILYWDLDEKNDLFARNTVLKYADTIIRICQGILVLDKYKCLEGTW